MYSGTEEDRGKGTAPKRYSAERFISGHMVNSHVTVIFFKMESYLKNAKVDFLNVNSLGAGPLDRPCFYGKSRQK